MIEMWLERFVIVVTSLHRDFLPSSWGYYAPTVWDWAIYIGTIGFFLTASVQLLFIGIIGEYLGNIHTQVLKRPRVVEKERVNF